MHKKKIKKKSWMKIIFEKTSPENLNVFFQGHSPSSVLLVSQHITTLISRMKLSRALLRELGLIDIVLKYLDSPTEYWGEIDVREVKICLRLLAQNNVVGEYFLEKITKKKEKVRKISKKKPVNFFSMKIVCLLFLVNVVDEEKKVIYGTTKSILGLVSCLLTDNTKNQEIFMKRNGLEKMYGLISDDILR